MLWIVNCSKLDRLDCLRWHYGQLQLEREIGGGVVPTLFRVVVRRI